MNAEFLVASLWGVVAVYWLWTRRPAGDSIGSFRNELNVLQHATPTRVPPANRLSPAYSGFNGPPRSLAPGASFSSGSSGTPFSSGTSYAVAARPAPVFEQPVVASLNQEIRAATRQHQRAEMRRRRRDVLGALGIAVLVTLVAAVVTRSLAVIGVQVVADAALAAYLWLLLSTSGRTPQARRAPAARTDRQAAAPVARRWPSGSAPARRAAAANAAPAPEAPAWEAAGYWRAAQLDDPFAPVTGPAGPVPSAYVPSAYVPSAYVPSAYVPSAYVPSAYVPSAYVPVAPSPATPVATATVPVTPRRRARPARPVAPAAAAPEAALEDEIDLDAYLVPARTTPPEPMPAPVPEWAAVVPEPAAPVYVPAHASAPGWEVDDEDARGPERRPASRAHSLGGSGLARLRRLPLYQEEDGEPYGDFGSYASLALAEAN